MRQELQELWKYRELLLLFVQRDLKVRYKNSVLGFGWSLLNPLVQVLTLTFVILFLVEPKDRPQNYHVYVFCAMMPWLFFNTALMDSTNALIGYYNLLRKTYFPREILPLAVVIANFIHFLLTTSVLMLYVALNATFWWLKDGTFNWPIQATVVFVPIPMVGLALLVTGLAMFVSVWTLYFEDVRFILDSALKILYWLVPILYFGDAVREKAGRLAYTIYMLNPLAGFLTAFRKFMLVPTKMLGSESVTPPMKLEDWAFLASAALISALLAIAGLRYFNSRKWRLAERA
jgi:lipopolysaccharide transport system permease protein